MKSFENLRSLINNKKIWYYTALGFIFIFAIALRINLFISNQCFEDDECRLILTILDKNLLQVFLPLGDAQSAPPLFLLFSKILAYLFGYKESILKFIPFVCNIASIFLFYKVISNYFNKKLTVLLALIVFVLVRPFISFSAVFKQYSPDIFVALLCLYYLPKLNLKDLSLKQTVLAAFGACALPFLSLPSVFFIGACAIQNFVLNYKNKNFYKKFILILIPFSLLMVIYYIFNLLPSKLDLESIFPNYWDDCFWNLSVKSFFALISNNLNYNFYPNSLTNFLSVLLFWGCYLCFADNSEKKNISNYILYSLGLILLASLLHLYPFAGRVALYFTPCLVILLFKPFDYYKIRSYAGILVLLCLIPGFCHYDYNYFKNIVNSEFFYPFSSKNLTAVLKEKFNPKEDIILCNSASASSYVFYSSDMKFITDKVYIMNTWPPDRESVFDYLNGLKRGQKYWIYMVKDYSATPISSYIFEWLKGRKILFEKKERKSYLIYFQN